MMEYEIHPAIGIARVGSSRFTSDEGFFIGPEPGASSPAHYRDSAGDLKRQAARFRIFACERDDRRRLLRATEVTFDSVRSTTWTVHLVNRKGTARRQYQSGPGFRNGPIQDDVADRDLVIDPGPRSVSTPGDRSVFDTGHFRSTIVPLGEIVMEPDGRLRVVGGFGRSGSDPQQPRLNSNNGHRADNRNWFDDISDGPVSVRIDLNGGTIVQSSAWIIVGPPDFAPRIKNFVTLYDGIHDLAVRRGLLPAPTDPPNRPSFTRHVQPILAGVLNHRWVNRFGYHGTAEDGLYDQEGQAKSDYSGFWERLADPSPASSKWRASLLSRLRDLDPCARRAEIHPLAFMPRLRNVRRGWTGADDVLPLPATQYKIIDVYPVLGAAEMVPWIRGLGEDYQDMIDKWDRLGFVVNRGLNGAPFFIETERDQEALGER